MRKSLTVLFMIFCAAIYGKNNKSYQCFRHDGNTDVFKTHAADFRYSEEDKIYYRISNDRDNIYIDVKIFDDEIKQKILYSGLTIWIDPEGKKTKKTGVVYPLRHQRQNNEKMTQPADRQEMQNMQNSPQLLERGARSEPGDNKDFSSRSLMLLGFSDSGPVIVSDSDNTDFRGSIRFQKYQNMLYYEVTMPLSKLPGILTNPSGKKKKSSLMLGFSYEPGMPGGWHSSGAGRPSSWNGNGNSGEGVGMNGGYGGRRGGGGMYGGGGMHGGGGMRGGGGMYGSGGGMHSGGRNRGSYSGSNSESLKIFWIKGVRLAADNN